MVRKKSIERLTLLNIKGTEAMNPANGSECATIDRLEAPTATQAGLTTWDSRSYAVLELSAAIRRAAGALINRSLYDWYMLRLRTFAPDLVSVVQSSTHRDFVIQILRRLLAEQISVRDLSAILEGVLELRAVVDVDLNKYIVFDPPTSGLLPHDHAQGPHELLPADYVEFVRMRLKRYISHKYTRGGNTLVVYLMDPRTEKVLAEHDELDVAVEAAILKAVEGEVGSLSPSANRPVILTTVGVRQRLRRLLSTQYPHLWVVSYQELSPDMNIQPIARITTEPSKLPT